MRRHRIVAISCWMICAPAWAGGGAHVVDDASVEDPGSCHVENWITQQGHGAGFIVVAPACTPKVLPRLELGGSVVHGWTHDSRTTSIGINGKLAVRPEDGGFGVAVNGSLGYSADRSRVETAGLIVPVTIPLTNKVQVNVDTGWQWAREGHRHDLFVGGQVEASIGHDVSLMAEAFTRTIDRPGGQLGLRWTPGQGKVDLDLIAGRYVDGKTPSAVTFGVTVRL